MTPNRDIVLISGGSKGLGRALVQALLDSGRIVATYSRSATPFIVEQQERDPDGRSFYWRQVDGTEYDKVDGFVRAVDDRFGRIDAVINNAGVAADGVLALMPPEDIHRVIALNMEGALRLARACARIMLARQAGDIINITSIIGLRGYSGLAAYSATKAGLEGMTRSLARELGKRGIRVNSVAPGYLETEMSESLSDKQLGQIVRRTPLGRIGTMADIVGAVQFLLSPAASFITGHTLVVDGGITC